MEKVKSTDYIEAGDDIPESIKLLAIRMLRIARTMPQLRDRAMELIRIIYGRG